MDAIELDQVSYVAGGRTLLSDLSLRLTEPRIGIVGRNGSGKTTLLRLLAGLAAPSAGRIRIGAVDPYADRKGALARLGILFQNPDHQILFPTVEEELAFGLRQQGRSQAQALTAARAALSAAGRADWAGAAVSTLSGGQRHWLCLQALLLMRPQTLLLDEPFSGLDLAEQTRMTRHLAALPQRLITIAHDPAHVAHCARVIWLDAGRMVADGPAETVLPAFTAEMARIGATDADADLSG